MLEPADDDDEEIRISKKALKDAPCLHVVIGTRLSGPPGRLQRLEKRRTFGMHPSLKFPPQSINLCTITVSGSDDE